MFTPVEFGLFGIIGFFTFLPHVLYERIFHNLAMKEFDNELVKADLRGKVIIVTGSNTGIGKETAKTLCLSGATVILACRDGAKAMHAVLEINSLLTYGTRKRYRHSDDGQAIYKHLDLSSFLSIISFVKEIKHSFDHVDILINNAGVNVSGKTKESYEQLFQINYLGHFFLFALLEPLLSSRRDKPNESSARVVNLSSVMHHLGKPDFLRSDYAEYHRPKRYEYYSDSKLFLNLFTIEINRRLGSQSLERRPIRAISCNPGAVRSDIWRHIPIIAKELYDGLMRVFYLSTHQGSLTSIFGAAVSDMDLDLFYKRYRALLTISDDRPFKWAYHPYLPYIIPYNMPWRSLNFEMIGPIAPPHYGEVSLPKNTNMLAEELWKESKRLCLNKLDSIVDDDIANIRRVIESL